MKNTVECINCQHFRMWNGDPCCVKNNITLVLPDLKRECEDFNLNKDNEWLDVWKNEKYIFFEHLVITEPTYSQYIKEHKGYKNFITYESTSD